MAIITSSRFCERMSRRLQRAGINLWLAESSGDAWGKYLLFKVGGSCVAGAGWTQAEAEEIVNRRIAEKESE
jgi:hypothetical protein